MSSHRIEKRTSLEINELLPNEPCTPDIVCSQKSLPRKGGLKPEAERMYSHKTINSENKMPSTKTIKSHKSIQFKNSN